MAKKTYHHGDLHTALLETTRAIIAAEGVEAVTMRGLSQRIGVSRTAPYRHFDDKASLLAAVAEAGYAELIARMQQVRAQEHASPLDRFQEMGVSYIQFATQHPTDYRLMFGADAVRAEDHPQVRAAIRKTHEELILMIRECQAAGQLGHRRTRDVALTVWAACHGLSLLLIDGHVQQVDEGEVIVQVAAIVRAGLEAQ